MPRADEDFTPIYSNEKVTLSFNFEDALNIFAPGETLVTPTWSIGVVIGEDADPTSRLIGSPSISGTFVKQSVGTYQPGVTYDHIATVTTTGDQILTTSAHQSCQDLE